LRVEPPQAIGQWLERFSFALKLSPVICYDKSAAIFYHPIENNLTLKQAALAKGVSEEPFDKVVDPLAITHPGSALVSAARTR
jgi:fumarate hydratase class II